MIKWIHKWPFTRKSVPDRQYIKRMQLNRIQFIILKYYPVSNIDPV